MVVDTVCVVQAFVVPQTLRAPGTLIMTFPAEVGLGCDLSLAAENLSSDFLFEYHLWVAVTC